MSQLAWPGPRRRFSVRDSLPNWKRLKYGLVVPSGSVGELWLMKHAVLKYVVLANFPPSRSYMPPPVVLVPLQPVALGTYIGRMVPRKAYVDSVFVAFDKPSGRPFWRVVMPSSPQPPMNPFATEFRLLRNCFPLPTGSG